MTLSVATNIPYGNASDVSIEETKDSATIFFAASPSDGPQSLWFCFRVKTNKKLKHIRFVLKHPYNMLMGSCDLLNILPVVKKDNRQWQRFEKTYQFYILPDGRYEISWVLNKPGKINDVALCYPYGTPELENLVEESNGYWKKDIVGVSTENRQIIRISNNYSFTGSKNSGIYIVARQHSGETPGSWVLDGFLRYLMSVKTQDLIVWAIPLSNIDGIEKGRYGKDYFPLDLNRSWGKRVLRHEILVIQRDIARWQERCNPLLGLDFHAPGGAEGDGVYFPTTNKGNIAGIKKKQIYWINRIGKTVGKDYMFPNYRKNARSEGNLKNLTGLEFTDYFDFILKTPGLCLEIPYGINNGMILTKRDYKEIGKRIATAILEEKMEGENDSTC